jgi:cell division protein FtsI (penicillin-binding protein 3)
VRAPVEGRATTARAGAGRTVTVRTTPAAGRARRDTPLRPGGGRTRSDRGGLRLVRRRGPRAASPERRLRFALVAALFLLSLLGGRLVQLQGLDASALAAQALDQRTMEKTLPAHRGNITDASGIVLATTLERRDLIVDQTMVGLYKHKVDGRSVTVGVKGAAQDLADVLHVPASTLLPRLTGRSRGAYVARGVTPEVARAVLRLNIPTLRAAQASRRDYPNGQVAANLLGFVGPYGTAWGGIEGKYDAILKGKDGSLTSERGADGTEIPTGAVSETDPVDGSSVRLTIDVDLQWKFQQVLAEKVAETKARGGFGVAVDSQTGQVLALVSVPTYDPNNPGKAKADTMGNPALLSVFEPGSTAKVITVAAALQEGKATPQTKVVVPPSLRRGGTTFHDAEVHGTEKLTATGVLAQSSNLGTIELGERMPASTLYSYLTKFGVGQSTGMGLPESRGILAPVTQWSDSQRYTVMFGQGLSVNALQAASVFATLANDGVRVSPRLVAGITDPQGGFHPSPTAPTTRVVSPQVAQQMRLMLENVVGEHGTAVSAKIPGYRVAGKTGTANYPDGKGGYSGYTASFIGMAPADHPRLVIAVVLDRPVNGYYGGTVAAPVFQEVMTYALAKRKIPPTATKPPVMPLQWH